MYVINSNDDDPSMRFEGLARTVFNCDRGDEPWYYSNADVFDGTLVDDGSGVLVPNHKCKEMLLTVTDIIIWNNKDSEIVDSLLEIKAKIWNISTQQDCFQIIDELIEIVESIDVY